MFRKKEDKAFLCVNNKTLLEVMDLAFHAFALRPIRHQFHNKTLHRAGQCGF